MSISMTKSVTKEELTLSRDINIYFLQIFDLRSQFFFFDKIYDTSNLLSLINTVTIVKSTKIITIMKTPLYAIAYVSFCFD